MEVDFSNLTFKNSSDVKLLYGIIEEMLDTKGQRQWFIIINYTNTQIFPDAWFQHALSGKLLNSKYSLGTVRFNPDEPAKNYIKERARQNENLNPNLVSSRDEALARIAERKLENIINTLPVYRGTPYELRDSA